PPTSPLFPYTTLFRSRVAIRLSRPQPAGVNLDLNRGALRVCGIEVELTVDVFEVPADIRNHHVARAEFCGRMSRFEEPSRQGSPRSFWVILGLAEYRHTG